MSTDAAKPRELPRVVVVLVVLATGAATVWAATKAGPLGPYTSWDRAQQAVQQIWTGRAQAVPPPMTQMPAGAAPQTQPLALPAPTIPNQTQATSTPGDALAQNGAARMVGLPGVPTIMWGASRPHPDRGACTSCHTVATAAGQRVPTIFSFAAMPHEYRGVCSNCHEISVAGFSANLVAGVRAAPAADAPMQTQSVPNEAEWSGMEVRSASQGIVITQAESTAARAGVQPGDVVDSINGVSVRTMTDFVQVTVNGTLQQGTMIARRNGQRIAFELQPVQRQATTGVKDPAQQQLPSQQQQLPSQQQQLPSQQQLMPPQQVPQQQATPQQWPPPSAVPSAPTARGG